MPAEPETIPEWRIEGDWFDLCSCAVGCPCVFSSQTCTITNAPRPEVTPGRITVGQALKNVVSAFGKTWSWANHSAKHIPFDMRGPGAFTWRKPLP